MPIIHPVASIVPTRPYSSPNAQVSSLVVPADAPSTTHQASNETGEKAVQPSAPPTFLQLQIQALISEQAEAIMPEDQASSEDPS